MRGTPVNEFRTQVEEVCVGIKQCEIDPSRISFEPVIVKDANTASYLALNGTEIPVQVFSDGMHLFGSMVELNGSTLSDVDLEEKAYLLNRRLDKIKPFVADVKDDIIIGKFDNSPSPLQAFDACLEGLRGNSEELIGASKVAPNYISCDFMLPSRVDPLEVGDFSHSAVHFTSNGKTSVGLAIYRLACTNGMTVAKDVFHEVMKQEDIDTRLLHTTIAAEKAFEAAQVIVEHYAMLVDFEVQDVDKMIRQLCKAHNITSDIAETVIDIFYSNYTDMGRNAYAVTQAFTYLTTHGWEDNTPSPAVCNKINKMLTNVMETNANQQYAHCDSCGANL